MVKVFDYFGAVMKEQYCADWRYPKLDELYSLSEPRAMSIACMSGLSSEQMKEIVDQIEMTNAHLRRCYNDILVMKTPQLIFYPKTLDLFEKVIICRRPPEQPWIDSMVKHGGHGWLSDSVYFLRDKNLKSIQDIGLVWHRQCEEMDSYLNGKSIPFVLDDEKSRRECLGNFLHDVHVDQIEEEMMWNRQKVSKPLPL